MSACQRNVTHTGDGTVDIERIATQQEIQDAVSKSIADPLIKKVVVTLRSGYIFVSGNCQRLNGTFKTDTFSFRVDLDVSNGRLTVTISNTRIDGFTVEQNRIDPWNTTISDHIANIRMKHPNTILKSVTVTSSAVIMVWTIAK